ncbi:MAG: efflux RND transporter permease subunit [Candidatus Omnitrophica bacterium]|nr:efflux RND transporter permease subunit [Candidatus Omnitrophota bacterium]
MKFAQFSVKNSLFVNLFSVFIIIAGLFSLTHLRKEAFPPVSFDVVTVVTSFRGASAQKVERLVTVPIEKELREVSNVEEIVSSSDDGISTIIVKVLSDVKDFQKVVNDIQKAVDRVTGLPEDVDERPIVSEITSGEIPVIKVAVSGDLDEFILRKYTDELRDLLEEINGVSSVERIGWRDEEFWVEPDITKMADYHISFKELARVVGLQNVDSPGGKIETEGKEFLVKIKSELRTKEDIESTVIRANDLGNWIKVKDVAVVRQTFEDDIILNKSLGSRAVTLTVIKREKGDIIKIVDNVKKIIGRFEKGKPKELKIAAVYDLSYYVKRRLNVLRSNGIIGSILVITVLFLFLPPVSAVMTAIGIPIAMCATFWIMYALGLTINLITMFGLITVLGMIVDDGIIISENVNRHIEMGVPPKEAAILGTNEVARPVLTTVLTTIVAFSPLMLMGGLLGRFIKYIPLVVIIALLASVVEAFFILPSHLADFVRPMKGKLSHKEGRWFKWIFIKYTAILKKALNHRYKIVGVVVVMFISSIVMAKLFMPFVLFSAKGVEQFSIRLEAVTGTSLGKTNEFISPVEKLVEELPPKYLDAYETSVGNLSEDRGYDPNAKRGGNFAQITVYLTPSGKRDKTAAQIVEMLRPKMNNIFERLKLEGVEKIYFQEFKEGPPVGRAIDVRIRGDNFDEIMTIVNEIKDYLSELEGVKDISDSYNLGPKEINVIIDEEKAQRAFLTNSDISFAVRAAFSGVTATTIKREKAEKEIRVLIRLPQLQRDDLSVFDKIGVANKFDNLIPLKDVTKRVESRDLRSIAHIDGKRFISITGDVDNKKMTSLKVQKIINDKFSDISLKYPGYTLRFSGEAEETMKSVNDLAKAFLIALLLIFLILATQFNSLVQPFIVMLAIPFGIIGFIVAFLIHGEPLSFLGILGFVGLMGIVVNDSIVLVDFINKRRNHVPIKEAIIEAGDLRLRPVLITTITTVCGLSTVAYGIGGVDPFLKPMALAISWGLLFATALTLIVIPCVYLIAEDTKNFVRRKFKCRGDSRIV